MHRRRSITPPHVHHARRNGLLFIGALREVSMIALVVGLLLMAIREGSSRYLQGSPKDSDSKFFQLEPILNLDFDRDRRSLLAHTYPEGLDEIRLSDARSTKRTSPQNLFSSATSERNSMTIMLTQWVQAGGLHHAIYIVQRDQVVHSEEFTLPELSTADARISSDGSVAIVVSHSGSVIGWDLTDVAESAPIRWEFNLARQSATNQLSPDGRRIVIAANDGSPVICDSRSGEILLTLPTISGCCRSAAWASDGERLSLGDESGNLFVYDAATGRQIWTERMDFLFARSMALSDDGSELAVGGFDKKIRIWDLSQANHPPRQLDENTSVVNDLMFLDDKLVAACLDGTIREWSLTTARPPRQIR